MSRSPSLSRTIKSATTASRATDASFAEAKPSHCCQPPNGSARVIQASAVSAKMMSTRCSALRHGPTAGRVIFSSRGSVRVTHHHASGSNRPTTGTPQDIHWPKLIVWPVVSSNTCTKMRLGGVPIGVPNPPMLHDQASPSRSGAASVLRSEHEASTASATGISISADAVLEIHILSSAPASMNPSTKRCGR